MNLTNEMHELGVSNLVTYIGVWHLPGILTGIFRVSPYPVGTSRRSSPGFVDIRRDVSSWETVRYLTIFFLQ